MELEALPLWLAAPIYGTITHYYRDCCLPKGDHYTLQALPIIEAISPRVTDFTFSATTEDFKRLTLLTAPTILKAFSALSHMGILERQTKPGLPTVFQVHWHNSALTPEAVFYMTDYQNALRSYVETVGL